MTEREMFAGIEIDPVEVLERLPEMMKEAFIEGNESFNRGAETMMNKAGTLIYRMIDEQIRRKTNATAS